MAGNHAIDSEFVSNLLLDEDNPRLPEDLQGAKQPEILAYIAKHESVEDLMSAIGRNGFFEGEPLVVYRNPNDARGKYRVIEGNRRLVSVMLLRDPSLYAARTSLREIAEAAEHKPEKLPIIKVAQRNDALTYIGSRHIVGVKQWDPLPKARYMLQLFKTTRRSESPANRYRAVAAQIGSGNRHDYIKKNLDALAVYNVIKKADFYDDPNTNEENFSFGVLYTAMEQRSIAAHVGIIKYNPKTDTKEKDLDPIVKPEVLDKKGIEELYDWAFRADDNGQTILGESRNLKKLGAVLKSTNATKVLRQRKDLDAAYEKSGGIALELGNSLNKALRELRYANSIVANAEYRPEIETTSKEVREQAVALNNAVRQKKIESEE